MVKNVESIKHVTFYELTHLTLLAFENESGNGLYIGTGNGMELGTLWSGLIDDVRIYDVALSDQKIEASSQ